MTNYERFMNYLIQTYAPSLGQINEIQRIVDGGGWSRHCTDLCHTCRGVDRILLTEALVVERIKRNNKGVSELAESIKRIKRSLKNEDS